MTALAAVGTILFATAGWLVWLRLIDRPPADAGRVVYDYEKETW